MNNSQEQPPSGILLVDKPPNWTSHDVVAAIRNMLPRGTKVGHTGTLDPFASGLLILLIGKEFTKQAEYFTKLDKTYTATIHWCHTSNTLDTEGEISTTPNCTPPNSQEVQNVLQQYVGHIQQIPPMHSALKINGKRLYTLARQGQVVQRKPRPITVHSATLLHHNSDQSIVHLNVSSRTYIRALVRDYGQQLHTGAYLKELRRETIGPWSVTEAVHPQEKEAVRTAIAKPKKHGIVSPHS